MKDDWNKTGASYYIVLQEKRHRWLNLTRPFLRILWKKSQMIETKHVLLSKKNFTDD